jgi:aminoglycoside phosphotransferase
VPGLLSTTLARFDESRPDASRGLRPPRPGGEGLPGRIVEALGVEVFGTVHEVRRLGLARSNLVLLIEGDRGRFVVKVADDPYRAWQLGYEHDIMRGLAEAGGGLPLARPLALAEEDGYTFLLQSWAGGSPGRDDSLGPPARVTAAARLLRAIHAHPLEPLDCQEILDRQLRLARHNMDAGLLDPGEFAECGSPVSTLRWLERARPPRGRAVLLHGDYRPKNILWQADLVTGVVDWGLALPGDPHYDLAVMRWYIRDDDLWQRFATAYGHPCDPARLRYYDLLSKFLNV